MRKQLVLQSRSNRKAMKAVRKQLLVRVMSQKQSDSNFCSNKKAKVFQKQQESNEKASRKQKGIAPIP